MIDDPLPGAVNMARDEALLQACRGTDRPPVLRFYAWSTPTISLGYFQDYGAYEALPPPAGGLPVVRRTTGGGAILHDLEVTYSLTMPIDHPLIAGRANELYRRAHRGVIHAVGGAARMLGDGSGPCDASSQRGPYFCFARRHEFDVVVDDPSSADGPAKLAGSAQRRTRAAVLQHGSIILDSRFEQQPSATWKSIGGPTTFRDAVDRLAGGFAWALNVDLKRDGWDTACLSAADAFVAQYASDAWTLRRERTSLQL